MDQFATKKNHPSSSHRRHHSQQSSDLGDFSTSLRVIPISLAAIGVGLLGAVIAWALLRLIGLFTNLFFYQRWETSFVSPSANHLGPLVILIPVIGGLIVGLMARYGSERIRGHGIPEAIEAILIRASRVDPCVAFWKPLSSAVSIGSGGPFGAEGPIIMTGGAFGSLVAQFMHISSTERRTLLVAGAAAGMSATFASPIAAVLLAFELLLFEWKPRSAIPVALASATAAIARRYLIGMGPMFPVPPHPAFIGLTGMLGCVIVGLSAGVLSALLTWSVYAVEDSFKLLPIHWMWWPALGGLAVGIGGWLFPQALGVGYDTIGSLLQGGTSIRILGGILAIKWIIWAVALGSGTSGGVLAPLLLIGGALGGLESVFLPHLGAGFWPLISMAAILGGTMRSPFTGIIFALELTHDVNVLLPLLIASFIAHGFTVLTLRRSILTEKISRRGYHLSREYAVDPLETVFVEDVMRTDAVSLIKDESHQAHKDMPRHYSVTAFPHEPLREVIYRMAEAKLSHLHVVEHDEPHRLVGTVALTDILKARMRHLDEDRRRRRTLSIRRLFTSCKLLNRARRAAKARPVSAP